MVFNTTNLAQFDGGCIIKQGDISSTFGYELLDENCQAITSLNGQEALVTLTLGNSQWSRKVTVENQSVVFSITDILPIGKYRLEISVGGYVFPSDNKTTHIKIVASDRELVTNEIHALKELDIAEEVKKQLAERPASEGGVCPEFPDLLFFYNIGKV
ncbi:phage protein [Streptococcus pneumoniae]|nr:phage protein [Streptococcus pneumoniae]